MSSNDPSKLITGIRDFYVVEGRPECRLFLFPHGEVSFSTMRFKVLHNDPAAYQDYCEAVLRTDPDPRCEKICYGSGSGSRVNFDTDPDPGKNDTDPDPAKKA